LQRRKRLSSQLPRPILPIIPGVPVFVPRDPPMTVRGCLRALVCAACLAGGVGCGSLGTNTSGLPNRYPLGDEARAARLCTPQDLPHELNKAWLAEYRVEPGDGLLVLPADLDSKVRLPADQTILADGSIDLGRYGRLIVAGKTVPEIEAEVLAAVKKVETAEDVGFIDVRLVNRQSKVFYVLGEVTTPGRFPLTGNETVLDGILVAGGMNDRSSWRDIILVRPSADGTGQVMRVDYGRIVRLGQIGTNYQLLPGDRIYVGSRHVLDMFFNFDRMQ
jgi:polysaccharide biosynthesis/export protein